jgi:hypothetical protein
MTLSPVVLLILLLWGIATISLSIIIITFTQISIFKNTLVGKNNPPIGVLAGFPGPNGLKMGQKTAQFKGL